MSRIEDAGPGCRARYYGGVRVWVPVAAYDAATFAAIDRLLERLDAAGVQRYLFFNQPLPGTRIPRGRAAAELRERFLREHHRIVAIVQAVPGHDLARVFLRRLAQTWQDRPVAWVCDVVDAAEGCWQPGQSSGMMLPFERSSGMSAWLRETAAAWRIRQHPTCGGRPRRQRIEWLMALPEMIEEHNPGFRARCESGMILSVPVGEYDAEVFDRMEAFLDRIRGAGHQRLLLFNQPLPGAPIPRGEAGRRLRELFRRERELLCGVVNAIPGEGLWMSAARVFMRALSLAYRDRPVAWVADVRDASEWVLSTASALNLSLPYETAEDLRQWLDVGLTELGWLPA